MSGSSSTIRMERDPGMYHAGIKPPAESANSLFGHHRPASRFGKVGHRKRLGQEIDVLDVDRFPQLLLGVAGHEQNLEIGPAQPRFTHNRWAVHAGHDDV